MANRFQVGDKVTRRCTGRSYTIVRVAAPAEFWITRDGLGRVETVPAYDLIEGDDVDSFDADFLPSVVEHELARRDARRLLCSRTEIVIRCDDDVDVTTWSDFADANAEMPELDDVAESLRATGRASIGGGAAPILTIEVRS